MLNAQIRQTGAITVAYLPMRGPYSQIPEGYGRLYEWIGLQGLQPIGMPEAVYFTAPGETSEEEAEWELWAPVAPGSSEVEAGLGAIGVKTIAEATVATAIHRGPYDSVESTYRALGAWISEEGHTIVGPPRERYLSEPDVPPEETLTEILFPIATVT
jgi:effector-binding domain-containing protein